MLERSALPRSAAELGVERRSVPESLVRPGEQAAHEATGGTAGTGAEAWIRQLCWRDFYAHVLLMWPDNARHEFQERLRGLEWEDSDRHLEAWQSGQTGYPLLDAGMRELAATVGCATASGSSSGRS